MSTLRAWSENTSPPVPNVLCPLGRVSDFFADMLQAKGLVGGFGLGVSTLVGAMYLVFLRIPGVLFLLIWGLLYIVCGLFVGGGAMLVLTSDTWAEEEEPRTHDDGQIKAAKYLGYTMFGESVWRDRGQFFFMFLALN